LSKFEEQPFSCYVIRSANLGKSEECHTQEGEFMDLHIFIRTICPYARAGARHLLVVNKVYLNRLTSDAKLTPRERLKQRKPFGPGSTRPSKLINPRAKAGQPVKIDC
jgi:hypothetical protein